MIRLFSSLPFPSLPFPSKPSPFEGVPRTMRCDGEQTLEFLESTLAHLLPRLHFKPTRVLFRRKKKKKNYIQGVLRAIGSFSSSPCHLRRGRSTFQRSTMHSIIPWGEGSRQRFKSGDAEPCWRLGDIHRRGNLAEGDKGFFGLNDFSS